MFSLFEFIPLSMASSWNLDFVGLDPSAYSIAIQLFVRLLGLIYVIAYFPFLFQIRGLIGKDGILPLSEYLEIIKIRLKTKRFYYLPTLFWISASDSALFVLVWSGIILGSLLAMGFYPPVILLLLYLIHLSLTSAGQDFLSFGWETLLMEITLATTLLVATTPFNIFGWISLNFLLLRFHIQAGTSKIWSRDKTWKELTAISYHYHTQPLPNTQAWYFDKFPMWFHKLSTLVMFYAEIIVPFAIFSPPEVRLFVFTQLVGLQITIWFTGNLSYLNHLTIVACVILVHNRFLESFLAIPQTLDPSPFFWQVGVSVLGSIFLILQIICFIQTFLPNNLFYRILYHIHPFHIAYPHQLFAMMTTKRYEIIVEGSDDGKNWNEYHFFYKPGNIAIRPRRISPYQPRIDWQAWFLPFSSIRSNWWFQRFLIKLLEGSPSVIKLLKYNPFSTKPPLYVRALIYDYKFTTHEERLKTKNWWKRNLLGQYATPMRLKTKEERETSKM